MADRWTMALMLAMCATCVHAQDPFNVGLPDPVKAKRVPAATMAAAAARADAKARPLPSAMSTTGHRDMVPGSCEYSQAALCYNYAAGSSVYKPSRKLMPDIPGMQRESVALRRDKITFRYSFK